MKCVQGQKTIIQSTTRDTNKNQYNLLLTQEKKEATLIIEYNSHNVRLTDSHRNSNEARKTEEEEEEIYRKNVRKETRSQVAI